MKLIPVNELETSLGVRDFSFLSCRISTKISDDSYIKEYLDTHKENYSTLFSQEDNNFNDADAYAVSGFIKEESNDNKGAIEDFTKSIEINGDNDMAYLGRGIASANLMGFVDAFSDLNKASNLGSPSPLTYLYSGYAKDCLEETEYAIADYESAIEIDPTITGACNNIGAIYGNLEEYETAIDYFDSELSDNGEEINTLKNRAETAYYLEKYEKALEDAKKVIQIEPAQVKDNLNYYYIRGACNLFLDNEEKYPEAIDDFTSVIKYEPDNADAYSLRGLVKYELYGAEKAKEEFITARNIYTCHNVACMALEKLGNSLS